MASTIANKVTRQLPFLLLCRTYTIRRLPHAPRAHQPAGNPSKSSDSTSPSGPSRAVHPSARCDQQQQQWQQQMIIEVTGSGFEGPALFTEAATEKMMKKTTTAATFPQSKNCYAPSYDSRTSQRRIEAQTRRTSELRRWLRERWQALSTKVGQHKAITQVRIQVNACTTPFVVEIGDYFFF